MAQDFSIAIIARDEEQSIENILKCVYGMPEVIVVDTGSKDRTVDIATDAGARVLLMADTFTLTPEPTALASFGDRFGWLPGFRSDTVIFNHAAARNFAAEKAKHDWIFAVDADELIQGDMQELRSIINSACALISCETIYSPMLKLSFPRIYNREFYHYSGLIHETLVPKVSKVADLPPCSTTDAVRVVHHQAPKERRTETYKVLEYLVATDYTPRNLFYLGREYYNLGFLDKAVYILKAYLEIATWTPEIAEAQLLLSRALWGLNRGDEARTECLNAIGVNPEFKEALNFMAEMSWEREATAWHRYAESATNDSVLFVRD